MPAQKPGPVFSLRDKSVRRHLGIQPGDTVTYELIAGGAVLLRPARPREQE